MNKPSYKNIVYNSHIQAGGNVHIGDIHYIVEKDFAESILFIKIQALQDDRYSTQLYIKSPHTEKLKLQTEGQALLKEEIELDVPDYVFSTIKDFQDARRGGNHVYRGRSIGFQTPVQQEEQVKNLLLKTFFAGDIATVCQDFIRLLQKSKIQELNIVIASDSAEIRNIPWEIMIKPLFTQAIGSNAMTLANSKFGIIRTTETDLTGFNLQNPSLRASPLKLLFITALPEDLSEKGKMLQIEDEQRKLIEAIGEYEATGDNRPKIVIEFLENACIAEIKEAIVQKRHDIVHISGHGSFIKEVKKGVLYLENEEGDQEIVSGQTLGQAISHFQSIKLLVLSACETAIAGEEGTVEQVAKTGIPAVIGMRFAVTDNGAKRFTNTFYGSLAKGASITTALADGRQRLYDWVQQQRKDAPQLPHTAEWFTPVVYFNQYMGALVDKNRYEEDIRKSFYPRLNIQKGKHTRLIGQGFIGRKRFLIQMRKAIQNGGQHICLQGLGGLGKTTLAEAFANNLRKRSGYRILMWKGDTEINEALILKDLLEEFKATSPNERVFTKVAKLINSHAPLEEKLETIIYNYLKGRKTLLIFDNFEDLQDDQHAIKEAGLAQFFELFLAEAPSHCHLIFTTRYSISNFKKNAVLNLQLSKMSYAEQYRYVTYSDLLRTMPLPEREQLYQKVDGHPRALEYLEGLARKGHLQDWKNLDSSITSVQEDIFANLLLEKIYTLLSPAEQNLFAQAGVLLQRSSLDVLTKISGQTAAVLKPLLKSLRAWSLCYWDEEAEELEVHTLTKEWLRKKQYPDAVTRRSLALIAGDYHKSDSTLEGFLLAKDYYEVAEEWEQFASTSFRVERFYQLRGLYQQAATLNQAILSKKVNRKTQGLAYNNLGLILGIAGKYQEALAYYQKNLAVFREIGDRQGEGVTLNNISQIYDAQGDYPAALAYLKQSLAIRQEIGDRQGEGVTLNNISQIYDARGDYLSALDYLEQSLAISQEIGDRQGEGTTLNNMATTAYARGDYPAALDYLEQSLAISQEIGDHKGEGATLNNISQIYDARGDYRSTLDYLEQSLEISQEIGDRKGEGVTLNNMATTAYARGDYPTALNYLEQSLAIQQEIGDRKGEGTTLNNMATTAYVRGDYPATLDYLEQSLAIQQEIGNRKGVGVTLNNIAAILDKEGQQAAARQCHWTALKICQEIGDVRGMATTLENIGAAYIREGQLEKAVPRLLQAYGIMQQLQLNVENLKKVLAYLIKEIGKERFHELVQEWQRQGE